MADFTKTITNSINIFGLEVSTKWGDNAGYPYTMVWGTSKWGYGTNTIIFEIEKGISNSIVLDDTITKLSEKYISNSLSMSEDMFSEKLQREGWNYVFPPGVSEGESRITTSWSEPSTTSQSYTCATVGSTTWT